MANYTLANLVKAQIRLQGEFAANDTRYRTPAVFLFILRSSKNFFPRIEELRTSEKRTAEANYFKRTSQNLITTGRTHDHTGTKGDSGIITLSWVTYSTTFSTTLKQADSSIYSWQEEFNNEIRQKVIDYADGFDAVSSTFLFNNRSGVNMAAVKGTFDATDDVYKITDAEFGQDSISITTVVMDINKYQKMPIAIICDSYSYTSFLRLAAQGASNATNQSFQFQGVYFIHDASLTAKAVGLNAAYTKGFWMAVPESHVAVVDWIPKQNRNPIETTVNMYSNFRNPVDGLLYAAHSYEERADGTSSNGEKQDVLTQFELSIDLAFSVAPSSVANETPIQAFALV
jgi:hypothetical protein